MNNTIRSGVKLQIRKLSASPIAYSKLDMSLLLKKSIAAVKQKDDESNKTTKQVKSKVQLTPTKNTTQKKTKQTFSEILHTKYKSEHTQKRSKHDIGAVNGFFYNTQVKLEWTSADFLNIPGERKRAELEKKLTDISEKKLELQQQQGEEYEELKKFKTDGDSQSYLPEIVFLGKCNSGKSTLLNSLLTPPSLNTPTRFAFSSKRAGFTETMNCFNLGKRFKLIDTPGYGVRGKQSQGEQVMQYLHNRKQLRRVYLLVGAFEGFSEDDFTIIDILVNEGVPFEIVFTKLDKIKGINIVERHIKESEILKLPVEPNLIFTNSVTNSKFTKREGLDELRYSIFESCGIKPGTTPMKIFSDDKK